MDSTALIIEVTERLIKKYESVIDKYEMNGNKLINFLIKREPEYAKMTEQYLSCNN